jgi:hypothetical protein
MAISRKKMAVLFWRLSSYTTQGKVLARQDKPFLYVSFKNILIVHWVSWSHYTVWLFNPNSERIKYLLELEFRLVYLHSTKEKNNFSSNVNVRTI